MADERCRRNEAEWERVRCRRAAARVASRESAEGVSPKRKNLMKKKRMRARVSWPRRKPWAKEPLDEDDCGLASIHCLALSFSIRGKEDRTSSCLFGSGHDRL